MTSCNSLCAVLSPMHRMCCTNAYWVLLHERSSGTHTHRSKHHTHHCMFMDMVQECYSQIHKRSAIQYACQHAHTQARIHKHSVTHTHVCMYVRTHTHTHTPTHKQNHTHRHTNKTHTHAHTHTQTNTQTSISLTVAALPT